MAKFKDLDLKLDTSEKISFGDVFNANLTYTTLSGYNTPSGVIPIVPASPEFVVDVPVAGERATKPYHLVRYDQLADAISEVNPLDWQESVINFTTAPPVASGIGERWLVASAGTSGVFVGHENEIAVWDGNGWVFTSPNEGFTLRVEELNQFWTFDGTSWGLFAATVDHSALSGLDGDDHEQYVLVDGSRGFTGTVSGINPILPSDLATKFYVDTVSGSLQTQLDSLGTTLSGNYVTLDTAQIIVGDKVFDNNLTTFLGDVFFNGIDITMSGTTLNTQNSVVFNFNDNSSIFFNAGSITTFSGVTAFETTPVFNAGLTISSGTILTLDGVTLSGTFIDPNKKWGRIPVINGARDQAVTFDTPWPDDDYTVVATLTNEIDTKPSIYSTIQGVKTGAGFTTHFSGKIDSSNFVLEWFAFRGQSH